MQQELPELSDYAAAFRRRRLWVIATAMLVGLITVYLAYGVPPTYRSEATVLIEQQDIPEEFVRSTVTGYADQRIQAISQRVMTRDNLVSIAEQHDLFPDVRASGNTADLVAAMRAAIFLETVQVQTLDEARARTYPITIAFNIAFEYRIPEKTRAVAEELSQLYLRENARSRSALATETRSFLEEEAAKLRSTINDLQVQMADFKEAHQDSMPDLTEHNREMMRRTETELQQTREAIRTVQDNRSLLLAELRTTERMLPTIDTGSGQPMLTAEERLRSLRGQYLSLSAIYSADHPDVQKLRREIRTLETSVGSDGQSDIDALASELAAREAELEDARLQYSNDHPTVRRLSAVVAELQRQIAAGPGTRTAPAGPLPEPSNPIYVQLEVQIDNASRELDRLNEKATRLERELGDYTSRFARIPQTERDWLVLTRDYDIAVSKYEETLSKLDEARRAVILESTQRGDRFTLIDPARVPESPIRPNQPVVLLVGLLFALGACAGIVALLEMLDGTVRGTKGLRTLIDMPALAAIPYVANRKDKRRAFVRRVGITTALAAGAACIVLIIAL